MEIFTAWVAYIHFAQIMHLKSTKDCVIIKVLLSGNADFECLLIKEQYYQNNLEKSYTERKTKDEPSGYSLSLICSFDVTKTRHYLYRGKDCVENFCKKLKQLGMEIINYKEKEMMPLADKENKFYKKQNKKLYMQKRVFYK